LQIDAVLLKKEEVPQQKLVEIPLEMMMMMMNMQQLCEWVLLSSKVLLRPKQMEQQKPSLMTTCHLIVS